MLSDFSMVNPDSNVAMHVSVDSHTGSIEPPHRVFVSFRILESNLYPQIFLNPCLNIIPKSKSQKVFTIFFPFSLSAS